jgi:methyl-accepting chemotaxis protein
MDDLVAQVRRVADLIGEISASALEQTGGIGRVSEAPTRIDESTHRNAALVQESAAAADSLQQQAGRLAEVVRIFRLDPAAAG